LIERRGGKVALVTTAGFKDLLEIGRQTRPKIYDLKADHPEPLVPREHRFEVAERIGPTGEVILELADAEIRRATADVENSGAQSVAVCFLFSFLNSEHERRMGEALRAALPGVDVSLSCEVQPEFREYERLSTTVLNAFLQPVAGRYMARLGAVVDQHAPGARIGICQSSGGLMSIGRAGEMPIRTVLSGPAAGVVGAVAAGARSSRRDLITFDMGGTSTDVCLVRDGKAETAFGRSVAGFPVRLPSIDIHTVGAGGGSIAHVGRDGLMRVGPISTGADPGPACYGKGGREPTVSDANLVLGRLPEELIGGGMRLDPCLAQDAIAPLAGKLGLSVRETALGIVRIVNANMMRAIRVVSIERGHDPRAFTLLPFGGAGALHAVEIARELGIRRALVPAAPGILCAQGVAAADMEESFVATCRIPLDGDLAPVVAALARLIGSAQQWHARESQTGLEERQDSAVDMRYVGQNFELAIPVPQGQGLPPRAWLKGAFLEAHQRKYGHHDPTAAIEIINVRLTARKARACAKAPTFAPTRSLPAADSGGTRLVWFSADRPTETTFIDRSALLPGTALEGPFVVTQFDATTLVPPRSRVLVRECGSLEIEVES
ncbi:MAG TPA: hydantoinase/oxoprolinase family protein, partial [Hyphomicrobiaceae bacterium]|nr:hydantoinase/oxoprolinase family protein [Hyphomicrobiaceae bacterium]